jgi:hypothetical protein
MNTYHEFQLAARENGYERLSEYNGQGAVWFRKVMPDNNTDVHKRMCVDSLTNSATVFWSTSATHVNSKTFRTVASLRDWFQPTL